MDTIQITLTLPAELVQSVEELGLSPEGAFMAWFEQEIERRREIKTLFDDIKKLHAQDDNPTPEEIQAEIDAYRQGLP